MNDHKIFECYCHVFERVDKLLNSLRAICVLNIFNFFPKIDGDLTVIKLALFLCNFKFNKLNLLEKSDIYATSDIFLQVYYELGDTVENDMNCLRQFTLVNLTSLCMSRFVDYPSPSK